VVSKIMAEISMPIPNKECCPFPFFNFLGSSLGLWDEDIIMGLPLGLGDLSTFTRVPLLIHQGGGNRGESVYAVPNPFGDTSLPTIFVGGAPDSFFFGNPFDVYLKSFGHLSWPEQLKLYQVAGSKGRDILATSGLCPQFSALTAGVLLDL
jgi:hypothetical protein